LRTKEEKEPAEVLETGVTVLGEQFSKAQSTPVFLQVRLPIRGKR
jgi:hypothetical protein